MGIGLRYPPGTLIWRHHGGVEVVSVDPRDQTWELGEPSCRVYFHDIDGASDEYQLSGADIEEVLVWAGVQRRTRTYVLYVRVPHGSLGLIRLAGAHPNDPTRRLSR
jgi:hypothetical protein